MAKAPKRHYSQGTKTKGMLDFELVLHFRIRPAGWAGNDQGMFGMAWLMIQKHVLGLIKFALMGDESVEVKQIRWRRPGETWQPWNKEQG